MRYIYFETFKTFHEPPSGSFREHTLQNVNVLKYKPSDLNSDGLWNRRNVTKYRSSTTYIDQYWIDLDKFKKNIMDDKSRRKYWWYQVSRVEEALKKIQSLEDFEN